MAKFCNEVLEDEVRWKCTIALEILHSLGIKISTEEDVLACNEIEYGFNPLEVCTCCIFAMSAGSAACCRM